MQEEGGTELQPSNRSSIDHDDANELNDRPNRLSLQLRRGSIVVMESHHEPTIQLSFSAFLLLTFKSMGIIFGDIGTSPLYVIKSIAAGHTDDFDERMAIGSVSIICYLLFFQVLIKYILIVLHADHHGEGGVFALFSQITSPGRISKSYHGYFVGLAILGAAMVIGDGALTPAISILSAVEGLEVFDSRLSSYIVPIAIVLVILLFLAQRFGTSKVGTMFAPVMLTWFAALAGVGVYRITLNPIIFKALNPWEGIHWLATEQNGFAKLGSIFLAVTGVEALYADLGHFSAKPIRTSWICFVFPSLILNYLGQGASIIEDPSRAADPFFTGLPIEVYWILLVLSIMATMIASQAMITGCFSLIHQASALGFFPTVKIVHTSKKLLGQVYIPQINYILMILTLIVIVVFQKSDHIANAYGVTVNVDMILTTIFIAIIMKVCWKSALWKILPFFIFFFPVDAIFLASNLMKIPQGGWISIVFASCWFFIMACWWSGQVALKKVVSSTESRMDIDELKRQLKPYDFFPSTPHQSTSHQTVRKTKAVARFPGMGVFCDPVKIFTPQVLNTFVGRVPAVPEIVVFLHIENLDVPFAPHGHNLTVTDYGDSIYRVIAQFGYLESGQVDVESVLQSAVQSGLPRPTDVCYFIHSTTIIVEKKSFFWRIPLTVFSFMKRTFTSKTNKMLINPDSVIEVGIQVHLNA